MAEIPAPIRRRAQIDLPAGEQSAQFLFEPEETRPLAWPGFYQHFDITRFPEAVGSATLSKYFLNILVVSNPGIRR